MSKQDLSVIEQDIEALYLGNLKTVEFDLDLPTSGANGSSITWSSSDERYLESNGKVHVLAYGKGKRDVILTGHFSYGEESLEKEYLVTVLEEANKIKVEKIYPIDVDAQCGKMVNLPTVAIVVTDEHKTISHSVKWDDGDTQCFDKLGDVEVHGVLLDTKIDVVANIHVVEKIENKQEIQERVVEDFNKKDVNLLDGSAFKEAQDRMLEVLLAQDDDQMLYNFRAASGLDTKDAPQMIGWDTPDSKLRGHTTGHYLSALALCYAATGNEKIKEKAVYMIKELAKCQEAFGILGTCHKGFLSAYDETQFDLLEKFTPYPEIWAPYYTLHKIMAGLLDCFEYVGIKEAYNIVDQLGDWVYARLSRLDNKTLKKMWGTYIAGEFGGMNESMAKLYQLSKKPEHLAAAKLFDNDRLFYPMIRKIDAIGGMHANQHIPQVIGAMKIYEAGNDRKYYEIAKYFWNIVTKAHIYAIGGTGETEMFHQPNRIGALLSDNTAESCASYNMLKLTKELFLYEPKASYMDYYERAMQNHILSSLEKRPTGASTYFMPLRPGGRKSFDVENSCCHGTGLENHFRYGDAIYHYGKDCVYVNLFLSSKVTYQGVEIIQHVDETKPQDVHIEVNGKGDFALKIRVPYWCHGEYQVNMNDKIETVSMDKDGYIQIQKQWNNDHVHIVFGISYELEQTPDRPEIMSLRYGPYVLAALSDEQDYLNLALKKDNLSSVMKQKDHTCEFYDEADGLTFVPIHTTDKQAYHVYFKLA